MDITRRLLCYGKLKAMKDNNIQLLKVVKDTWIHYTTLVCMFSKSFLYQIYLVFMCSLPFVLELT